MGQRVIITGGAGSGKTTVLMYIACTLATAIVSDNPNLAQEKLGLKGSLPLPVFIPLGAYAKYLQLPATPASSDSTLAAFIAHYLIDEQCRFTLPHDFLRGFISEDQPVILLLDGLDEVPSDSERIQIRQAIEELATSCEKMRTVVTCRTAAYKDSTTLGRNFCEVRIKPPDIRHTEALIRRAYGYIYHDDPVTGRNKADELLLWIHKLEADRRHKFGPKVEPLISSPLLVRMSLIVHSDTEALPEHCAEFYKKAIDNLLSPREYAPDAVVGDWLGRLIGGGSETHRNLLKWLAFTMHKRGRIQGQEISEEDLRQVLESKPFDAPLISELIALTRLRGAVLEERNGWYRFAHLSFQEYLVACYLAEDVHKGESLDEVASFLERGPILESWWREPALLIIGYLSVVDPKSVEVFVRRLAGVDERAAQRNRELSADTQLATAEIATMAILEWPTASVDLRRELAGRLVALYKDIGLMGRARPSLRAAAGDALARLGDPRFRAYTWYLPDEPLLGIVEIPTGPFLLGSDKERDPLAHEDELPQHEVRLPTYYIGRYPVTCGSIQDIYRGDGTWSMDHRQPARTTWHPSGDGFNLASSYSILQVADGEATGVGTYCRAIGYTVENRLVRDSTK
jgi:hypothetical protein